MTAAGASPLYWFPFDVGAWLTSPAVSMMLPEQEGAYIRLLVASWGKGDAEPSLPADDAQLAQLSRLGARWKKLGPLVREQFELREGRLVNAKLAVVWWQQQQLHATAVVKAKKGGQASAAQRAAKSTRGSTPSSTPSQPQAELTLAPGSTSGAQNLDGVVTPAPYGAGDNHPPTPDGAPAPEGARFAGAVSGEGRLVGASPLRTLVAPSIAEQQEAQNTRARRYFARLCAKADAWMHDHPDAAAVIDGEERMLLEIPLAVPVPAWQARILRDAVIERIRDRNGWPDADSDDAAWDDVAESAGALP